VLGPTIKPVLHMGLAKKIPSNQRVILSSVFLIANALIWYFSAAKILEGLINRVATNYLQTLGMWSLHFAALTVSLIAGALLIKWIDKKSFFIIWTVIGIVSPVILLVAPITTLSTLLVSFLFGISLGIGMPCCMEVFSQLTDTKNRGRYSGIIMFLSGLGVVVLALFYSDNIQLSALTLIIWRLLGLLILPFLMIPQKQIDAKEVSYSEVVKQRSFILYLAPWLMFCLVTHLSIPIQASIIGNFIDILTIVESAIIGVFAVISGFLVDKYGRKRVAMIGFIMIGTGYSVLGLSPNYMESWLFYTVADGIAWGIFYVIFVMSVWGDLSFNGKSAKYYAIGVIPFFMSKYVQFALGNYVATISPYALFSFTAFFLFLAVLPLVYAPETLSDRIMKARDLQNYVKKALEKAQLDITKSDKEMKNSKAGLEVEDKSDEDRKEYKKAAELAEKYY
jgi:MFS family permease